MYLLGYDIGSSSVKASLVNAESGKCVSSAFFPKTEAEIIAVKPGWAEQNPENWWENLKLATQAVLADARVDAADIKAIGILPDARIGVRGQRTKGIASCNHLVRFQSRSLRTKSI
jgi:ribulose kinase